MKQATRLLVAALLLAGCGTAPEPRSVAPVLPTGLPPVLPDSSGFGTHVLAIAVRNLNEMWVGTYGKGVYVMRPRARDWERIATRANDTTAISFNFVNSLGFGRGNTIWYGTVGNGFGRSSDGGKTWQNWASDELDKEYLYVAADGIRARGDTVYIATADGLLISRDAGSTWRCVKGESRATGGSAPGANPCAETIHALPTEYLLSIDVTDQGTIWAGHLKGVSMSTDRGQTWTVPEGLADIGRVRAIDASDTLVWIATEEGYYRRRTADGKFEAVTLRALGWPNLPGQPRVLNVMPGTAWPLVGLNSGLAAPNEEGAYRLHYLSAGERYPPAADVWTIASWAYWPISGTTSGLARVLAGEFENVPLAERAEAPAAPRHPLFARPIGFRDGNPFIDATYRYGSTMGGNFQQHQGVEFNNPAGTPVRAIGDGVVVYAGPAERGANTVAIRHDQRLDAQYVFSTYYHNATLEVAVGQRVRTGDVIARVGNTGRATNDHLHLEVHVAPTTDSAKIVNPEERFPPHTVNPQLWIEPIAGTGIIVGRVLDQKGQPVPGARVHGLVVTYPEETPFSFAETYSDRAHSHPLYQENFAVGDVPAGNYSLGVDIGGRRVWKRVTVRAGMVTFVEFRPGPSS